MKRIIYILVTMLTMGSFAYSQAQITQTEYGKFKPSVTGKQFAYVELFNVYEETGSPSLIGQHLKDKLDLKFFNPKIVFNQKRDQAKLAKLNQSMEKFQLRFNIHNKDILRVQYLDLQAAEKCYELISDCNFPYWDFKVDFQKSFGRFPRFENFPHKENQYQGVWRYDASIEEGVEEVYISDPTVFPKIIIGYIKKGIPAVSIFIEDINTNRKMVVISKSVLIACEHLKFDFKSYYYEKITGSAPNYPYGQEFYDKYRGDIKDLPLKVQKFFTTENWQNIISCR